ncbi:uncharacterized protein PHACADRAFT_31819 [Phanerochaete carnosa HHB-10118-sp]|uniref:Uncharacterized protein n=1 Tax=Phanerochaete carnosa (strain HHB-10118-sp) TaxID=650164 RepID=K5UQD8_PHACS|nr:uncharacterized protein PHACADRAFT_31819 [Phanerochaete carnosa HHB-10118-sp]EKM52041.1 hypothetical protein PHACADRAFT_31819 [Phanerochaete carnosa HHB-10118-sp]
MVTNWCISQSIEKRSPRTPELVLLSERATIADGELQVASALRKRLNIRVVEQRGATRLYVPCTSATLFQKAVSPEISALASIFALVLKVECEHFSEHAAEVSLRTNRRRLARIRAIEAFSLCRRLPVQLEDADVWSSFMAATGRDVDTNRLIFPQISADVLSLVQRIGRRVQWNSEHQGLTFDLQGETTAADYGTILCHLPINSGDSMVRDHLDIFVFSSIQWFQDSSIYDVPPATVATILHKMVSAANLISRHGRRDTRGSIGADDEGWIRAIRRATENISSYATLLLQLLHAFEISYRKDVLVGNKKWIRRELHLALDHAHQHAHCELLGCLWKHHHGICSSLFFFDNCPLLYKQASRPGKPSPGDYLFPRAAATSDIPVACALPVSLSQFDDQATRSKDTLQSIKQSAPAGSVADINHDKQKGSNWYISVTSHPSHPSGLRASSSLSAADVNSAGGLENVVFSRGSVDAYKCDGRSVADNNPEDYVESSPAPHDLNVLSSPTSSIPFFESIPFVNTQHGMSDPTPNEESVAHQIPLGRDLIAEDVRRFEARAEARESVLPSPPAATPSLEGEASCERDGENHEGRATDETADGSDYEAVEGRKSHFVLSESAVHEIADDGPPYPAGARPLHDQSPSSRRDVSSGSTESLHPGGSRSSPKLISNGREMMDTSHDAPTGDIAIAPSDLFPRDGVAEAHQPDGPLHPRAALLFQGNNGVIAGQPAEEFELALRENERNMGEHVGEQDGVESRQAETRLCR